MLALTSYPNPNPTYPAPRTCLHRRYARAQEAARGTGKPIVRQQLVVHITGPVYLFHRNAVEYADVPRPRLTNFCLSYA